MTAYTLTKHTNIRQLTVAGGYSARTGGDTIANTNGWSFTIDQDTQYGLGAPAFAAATAGSLGSITQTAASGGDIFIDATKVWLIPYNTGSGTLAPSLAGVTIGGVTCNTIALYSAMTAAPATTGATGWLKVTNASNTPPSSGSFTSDGFTYTITGAAVRGWIEIVGDDAATMTLVRLGKLQVRGAYYEIGTTTGTRASTYNVPNNGKQQFVPAIEVQGASWTITGATWANGVITYTTSATHDMLVGQPVTVTGITPAGFNVADLLITDAPDITDTTFSVVAPDPGAAYTSGGTAIAYELWPCAGTLAATAANVYDENTRRGKLFWNTNATTSLTAPLGYVRFGHDGTNSTGGYCPPAGRKIRIPNIFFTNCTTAARNQNVLPNATLATRYDFTTTSAGVLDIDKASMCWYLSVAQAYQCVITDSNFMSQVSITEVPTEVVMKNVAIGQEAAVVAVSPVVTALNPAGSTMHNVVGTQAGTTGTGGGNTWALSASAALKMKDCVSWIYAFRTGTVKSFNATTCPDMVIDRLHLINCNTSLVNCANKLVRDTKYSDTTGTRQTTQAHVIFGPNGPLASGVISGLKFVGFRAQNWGNLVNPSAGLRGPLKVRNFGSLAAPLQVGDGPYRDIAWTRTTTVCTVNHTAHGLVVGDNINVYWNSSTSAISVGAKTVASVPNANSYTFTCTNGGDASGTLSYSFCNFAGLISTSSGSNAENVKYQQIYFNVCRGGINPDNSNNKQSIENYQVAFDPTQAAQSSGAVLNFSHKFGQAIATGLTAVSQYGSTWFEGPTGALPDTDSFTWGRVTTTATLTTTSGFHNASIGTSKTGIEISGSSSETALNNGFYTIVIPSTAGDTADKFRLQVYNAGAASGTANVQCESGRISLMMNEGTAENTHYYDLVAGNGVDLPRFTGSSLLRMPNVGDKITFESPYFIRGHTGFMSVIPAMTTATLANFWIEYQIDTGSGYGAWKTAFRQTATAVSAGTAGLATVSVAAADSWIANGDRLEATTSGAMNRAAKVLSGGGSTTITMDKNHNGTFSSLAVRAHGLANENANINYETGFKLKIRITTLIAGTGATNTIGTLSFRTLTTAASRQITYPLDSVTLTLSGLPTGSDVTVLSAGTETVRENAEDNTGTTFDYTYADPGSAVDIVVIKPGYMPFDIRNYVLSATATTLPISLTPDLSKL